MKQNIKALLRILAMLMLVTLTIATFVACGEDTPGPDVPDTPDDPPSPPAEVVEVKIIEKGVDTEYVIICGSNGGSLGYSFKEFLLNETTAKHIEMTTDESEYDHEILVGNTSRQLSKDLKAECESKYAKDSHVWGFAYRDGKFAFYFNTQTAFTKGLNQMNDEYIEKRGLTVSSDTWVTYEYTAEQEAADKKAEEDKLAAEEEAKKKAEYEARATSAKKQLNNFINSDFGVTDSWETDYAMPVGQYVTPPAITEQHPRVSLTADTIPLIRLMLEKDAYANMKEALWNLADSKNFTGIFETKTHTNNETYRYDEQVLAQIEARALAYLITGEKCYGYEAILGIKNAMLTYKYTPENHADVYNGSAHILMVLTEVYDWCYDLLTDNDKAQLISGCVYLLIKADHFTDDDFVLEKNKPSVKEGKTGIGYGLEFNFPPSNYNAMTGHGPGLQFLRVYMMASSAFADEMPSWWDFVAGRYIKEFVPAAILQFEGGNVPQGSAYYGPKRILHNLEAAYVVKCATGVNPLNDDMKLTSGFMLSHIMGNGKAFETGDGRRPTGGATVQYTYFYYLAALYNDSFALQAAGYYSNNYKTYDFSAFYTMPPALTIALAAECDEPSGVYPDDMPLVNTSVYPAGQTIVRNHWGEDSAAVFMKIGGRTLAAHDLMDSGTFQIYYKGFLARTSGNYTTYGSNHHNYYLQTTVGMNGLLVYNPDLSHTCNGWYSGSQKKLDAAPNCESLLSGKYDIATVTGHENGFIGDNVNYAYIAGDITKAYDEATVNNVERRMLAVYTQDESFPMIFFVYDNVTSDEANFKKSFLLHTVNEPTVGINDKGQIHAIVTDGEGKLVLTNVAGGDNVYAIGGEGYTYWIGNNNEFDGTSNSGKNLVEDVIKPGSYDSTWGRVEITANGEKTTRMLNTMYVTDAGTTEVLESVAIENATVIGATVGGNITAVFVKSANRATSEITFTAEGDETMKYYVSGVTEGTWEIYVNGVLVGTDEATEDGGFLYFEASAGEVTLKPVTE